MIGGLVAHPSGGTGARPGRELVPACSADVLVDLDRPPAIRRREVATNGRRPDGSGSGLPERCGYRCAGTGTHGTTQMAAQPSFP